MKKILLLFVILLVGCAAQSEYPEALKITEPTADELVQAEGPFVEQPYAPGSEPIEREVDVQWLNCLESDRGNDAVIAGQTDATYIANGEETTLSVVDTCYEDKYSAIYEQIRNSPESVQYTEWLNNYEQAKDHVIEYVCEGSSFKTYVRKCDLGCFNGACAVEVDGVLITGAAVKIPN